MPSDSFNETMNAMEKEKKIKQLADMIAVQEGISYDKAYQRAQKYIEAGIERPYLGRAHSNVNRLTNNSVIAEGEEKESVKIKGNIKKSKTPKEFFKKCFMCALIAAVVGSTAYGISVMKDTISDGKVTEEFAEQVRDNYGLDTSFIGNNSKVTMSNDGEYIVITYFDEAARSLYESVKEEEPDYIDSIMYNEFRSCRGIGNIDGTRSEDEDFDNQITMMSDFINSYKSLDSSDNVFDYDNFISYVLRVVEKNHGLDRETLNGIKSRMSTTKKVGNDGLVEVPNITNKDDFNLLFDAYEEVGISLEKAYLETKESERGVTHG